MTLTWERDIVIRNENETLVDAVVRLLLSGKAINGKFVADETAAIMLIHHPDIEDIVGQVPERESCGENTWTTAKYDAQPWWKMHPTHRDQLRRMKELHNQADLSTEEIHEQTEILGHLSVIYGSASAVWFLMDHPELAEE